MTVENIKEINSSSDDDNRLSSEIQGLANLGEKEFRPEVAQTFAERDRRISTIQTINSAEVLDYGGTEGVIVKNREDLKKIIEAPCLEACLDLYDKNIQTVNSSANAREIGDMAYIGINYDSLDNENRKILDFLVEEGIIEPFELSDNPEQRGGRIFAIKVPVFEDDSVGTISDRFMQIASKFQPQDVLYGKHDKVQLISELANYHVDLFTDDKNGESDVELTYEYVLAKLSKYYGISNEEDLFESLYGYKYDEELDLYWENQELYDKHKQYRTVKRVNEDD